MAKYNSKQALAFIESRSSARSTLKSQYKKWWNAFKGRSWWAADLPLYKVTEVDNQIFPAIQSIVGFLSRSTIRDKIIPPSNDKQSQTVALQAANACADFWRVNRRSANIQSWFRSTLTKGDTYFFIRVKSSATYPFLIDAIEPERFIEASESIEHLQDQPWVAREISASAAWLKGYIKDPATLAEVNNAFPRDEDEVMLYDFWSKVGGGQNLLFTKDRGITVSTTDWPYVNKAGRINFWSYPFTQLRDITFPGASRSISSVEMVYNLQKVYDKQKSQVWENAEYMGNPPIVVDVESGIDTKKIEGKPRLIIKKYRDGDFRIVPVPPLPRYVENLPEKTRESIQRNLGWSPLMEQGKGGAARERGAISLLQTSGFASMAPKLENLAQFVNDTNNIFLGLLKHYQRSARKALELSAGSAYEGFSPSDLRGAYHSKVVISGIEPEKERKRVQDIQNNVKLGLFSRKQALREMDEDNPDAIVDEIYEERKRDLEFEREKAEYLERQKAAISPPTEAIRREEPKEKEVEKEELKEFPKKSTEAPEVPEPNYVDFMGNVLIKGLKAKLEKLTFAGPVEILVPGGGAVTAKQVKMLVLAERDRVKIVEAVPNIAAKIVFTRKRNPHKGEKVKQESKKKENFIDRAELLRQIKKGIIKSSVLKTKDLSRFDGMSGMYLTEPHSEMIWTRQKKLILKGRAYPNMLDKDFLLIGDKAYGVIRLLYGGLIKRSDVLALEKLHRVTSREWKKWWGDRDLYAYAFQMKRFVEPFAYEKKAGIQTFQKVVHLIEGKVKEPQAKVVTGGLTVQSVAPGKFVGVAKPEKKALTTNEVYSIERLKEILPTEKHDKWDVSWKADGIRCQVHKKGKEIIFFSDEARKIDTARLEPIVAELRKKFSYDVVLDGELMLFRGDINLKHQAIAGYIHSHKEPTSEEKEGLRYVVWDILYVRNDDVSKKPFEARSKALDLFLKETGAGHLRRVKHAIVSTAGIPNAVKSNSSNEGAMIRAADASYWHTALMFKAKKLYDIDVKIISVRKTKIGAWVYRCVLRDGTPIGETYGQKFVKAKVGDIIRINVDHITLRPSGRLSWFSPKPLSRKGEKAPAGKTLTTPGIGGPDTLAQIKEVFLAQGGSEKEWKEWEPKHKEWVKSEAKKLIESWEKQRV